MSALFEKACLGLACIFLLGSWFAALVAIRGYFIAVERFGFLDLKPFLDSNFGFFGLFSFGMSSLAFLFSTKAGRKTEGKLVVLLKVTLFSSAFLIIPVVLATAIFVFGGRY